ncbi:ABC transporter permease [Pseudarthrobacter raffinosi]|uniref:ABC transporter permease n=1 Tax=Pseudarthrobacter raffinosi TaxID=2953651 RepID=UPI00208FBA7D|nr:MULTISPECIES: ABC transporter permease [unclassified Pseudarthrobacter]MCO4251208.1 ABC transporter permease [Pseudarthrobacter sp. MDT3-9]MCO4265096.1 ABC transporter permease [Pseudarthrobacter sp. MDT3-26]
MSATNTRFVRPLWSGRSAGNFIREYFVYIALVALVAFFSIASPVFFSAQNFANVGRQTAIVSIIAVGVTFVIVNAQIDLSVGSVFALCGMVSGLALQYISNFWLLGALAAIAVGVIFGFINGLLTVKLGVPSFLVTLGMLGVARGIALIITDTRPVLIANRPFFSIFGDSNILGIPIAVVWTVVIVALGVIILHKSVFGLRVFATGGNPQAARFTGVNTQRTIILSFVITGGLVGLSSLLFTGIAHAARPDVGVGLELDVIAAVILGGVSLFGGRGTIIGALAGSLIIGMMNNGLVLMGVDSSVQQIIKGLIIIAAVSLSKK